MLSLDRLNGGMSLASERDGGGRSEAAGGRGAAGKDASTRRTARVRLRVAWMYYVEGLTQNEIAEKLGIGRVTVVRYIADAKRQREVKIWIEGSVSECVALERKLEQAFGLDEAIVVPEPSSPDKIAVSIGAATGEYISEIIHDDMSIGVGWGQTLMESLATLSRRELSNVQIVSLLGGITKAKRYNPSEFAWLFASAYDADCYLMAAPALVDSVETKRALIERCGLDDTFRRAERLDMALLSVGVMMPDSTSMRFGFVSPEDRASLIRAGAIGDICYNFFDAEGNLVDHPINHRVMSIPMAAIKRLPRRVLASGGMDKVDALLAGMKLIDCNVLITNEATAAELLVRRDLRAPNETAA